jgi:hypothetical protein
MIAYYVYDKKKKQDSIVLPDLGCRISVTPEQFEKFIAVKPEFHQWTGEACSDVAPEHFGTVVASRHEEGDVFIFHDEIWRERMFFYMSGAVE